MRIRSVYFWVFGGPRHSGLDGQESQAKSPRPGTGRQEIEEGGDFHRTLKKTRNSGSAKLCLPCPPIRSVLTRVNDV